MGNYRAEQEQHEQLLVDYGIALYEGRYEDADHIRNSIIDKGWNTQSDFNNYIDPSVASGNPENWLNSANSLAEASVEQRINNDIANQVAASTEDDFWEGDGSLGKKAEDLRSDLEGALNEARAAGDELTVSLLEAKLDALEGGTGLRGYDLAALATGEFDEWSFEDQPENASRLRWASQCYLASQIKDLAKHHLDMHSGYRRVHMLGGIPGDEGQARLIVNKMFARRDMSEFVEIKPFELSQVSPKLEVWKIAYDENLKYLDEVRLPFPAHSLFESERSVLESARSDFGISAVNWVFQGSNPDLVRNDIEAQITFYFQGFDSLVAKHNDIGSQGKPVDWSYLDLLGFGHGSLSRAQLQGQAPNYNPEPYEMKLVLGYNTAPSTLNDVEDKARREALLASLESQRMELYLTLIDHDIDVKDTGTIFIKCHFRARMEAVLSDPKADVLTTGLTRQRLDKINAQLEKAKRGTDEKLISDTLQDYNEELDRILNNRLKNIIRALENKGYLYNVHITSTDLGNFAATGISPPGGFQLPAVDSSGQYGKFVTGEREAAERAITAAGDDPVTSSTKERLRNVKPMNESGSTYAIHYFYFGDLIEILADNAFSTGNLQSSELNKTVPKAYMEASITEKMKIILGPLEYERVLCGLPKSVNLASIPIAADTFVEFFYNQIVRARTPSFTLLRFIRLMTQDLIVSSLGDKCPGQKKSEKIGIQTLTLDAPQTQNGMDPMTHLLLKQNKTTGASDKAIRISYLDPISVDKSQGVLWNPTDATSLANTYSYLMVYTQQEIQANLTGDPNEDKSNGIHHLYIGQDRGLLKSISFQKTDQPHLREARFQTVSDNPLYALSNVYNISVSMFGNNLFYPGVYLYLNPMGLGSELGDPSQRQSIARAMGIGGYHYVTEVSHKIEGGSYSTTVNALFESSGGGRSFCDDEMSPPGTRGGPIGVPISGYGSN